MNKFWLRLFPLCLLVLTLGACSSTEEEFGSDEEEIYNIGVRSVETGNWTRAIAAFQQIEAAFPFGRYAAQSQLELIYAYYQNGEA